jgi:hypothetical protein
VKIEPYCAFISFTYSKNGLPERATWKRLPTIGHPGGPGGRLWLLDLVFCLHKYILVQNNGKIVIGIMNLCLKEKGQIFSDDDISIDYLFTSNLRSMMS